MLMSELLALFERLGLVETVVELRRLIAEQVTWSSLRKPLYSYEHRQRAGASLAR